MGFFKDFKDDLSQAVEELSADVKPEVVKKEEKIEEPEFVNTLDESEMNEEESLINEEPEAVEEEPAAEAEPEAIEEEPAAEAEPEVTEEEPAAEESETIEAENTVVKEPEQLSFADYSFTEPEKKPASADAFTFEEPAAEAEPEVTEEEPAAEAEPEVTEEEPAAEAEPEVTEEEPAAEAEPEVIKEEPAAIEFNEPETEAMEIKDTYKMEEIQMSDKVEESNGFAADFNDGPASDESSVITAGMTITGDVTSDGSIDVLGTINGNVSIKGKLTISGTIKGDSKASEIFADSAKITGQLISTGALKIGQASVILGNVSATSAVVAGAVKGDIDVHGPVILDTSAIVMGDIRSKSVQINNGAVIEGHCSQCYAEVSPTSFFQDIKEN